MSNMSYSRRSEAHVVYRFFDEGDRLLYVGCTIDFGRRLSEHRKKSWFHLVDRWTVTEYPNFYHARAVEHAAIRTEGALYTPVPNGPKRWPMGAEMASEQAS